MEAAITQAEKEIERGKSFWLSWRELLVISGLILCMPTLIALANGGGPDRILAASSTSGTLLAIYWVTYFNRRRSEAAKIARERSSRNSR
jgi:hypothetical protein